MTTAPFMRSLVGALLLAGAAHAQPASTPAANGPEPLVVYFDNGSARLRAQDEAVLDQASRAFNAGHPIVMSVIGGSDGTGPAGRNLLLSQQRANAVLNALVQRGIPVDRFQVVAKGETDPAVRTAEGAAEPRNRRVEITWR